MKEIIALHENILSLPEASQPEECLAISKDEISGGESLPAEILAEAEALQQAINPLLPDDFDYFVFAGSADDEPPSFSLDFERAPTEGPDTAPYDANRSILDQIREVDWEQRRAFGGKASRVLKELIYVTERLSRPLPPAKGFQRQHREEMKDFVKEKRADPSKVHVLYWNEEEEIMEIEFADGAELRDKLPALVAQGEEIVAIVAGGKPLPVERIDALKAEAQKTMRERMSAEMKALEKEETAAGAPLPVAEEPAAGA